MASNVKPAAKLGVFTLVIMNVVAVVSLRGLPAEAEYGISRKPSQRHHCHNINYHKCENAQLVSGFNV